MENEKLTLNYLQKLNVIIGFIIVLFLVIILNGQMLLSQNYKDVGLPYTDYVVNIPDNKEVMGANVHLSDNQILSLLVSKEIHMIIGLYDLNGNLVKLLLYDNIPAGKYEYDLKYQIPPGNYICKLNSGDINENIDFIIQ